MYGNLKRNKNFIDDAGILTIMGVLFCVAVSLAVFMFASSKTLVARGDEEYTDYSYSVENVYKEGFFDYRVVCSAQGEMEKYSTIEAKVSKKIYDKLSVGDTITITHVKTYIENTSRTDEHLLKTDFVIDGEHVDNNDVEEIFLR